MAAHHQDLLKLIITISGPGRNPGKCGANGQRTETKLFDHMYIPLIQGVNVPGIVCSARACRASTLTHHNPTQSATSAHCLTSEQAVNHS